MSDLPNEPRYLREAKNQQAWEGTAPYGSVPVFVVEGGMTPAPRQFKAGGTNVFYRDERVRLIWPPLTMEQWVEGNWDAIVYSSGYPWTSCY